MTIRKDLLQAIEREDKDRRFWEAFHDRKRELYRRSKEEKRRRRMREYEEEIIETESEYDTQLAPADSVCRVSGNTDGITLASLKEEPHKP